MGRGTVRGRKKEEEPAMVPVRITTTIPRARADQLRQLRQSHTALTLRLETLKRIARSLTVRASPLTQEIFNQEADKVSKILKDAGLTKVPILGDRYTDEIAQINKLIQEAKDLGGTKGQLGNAWNKLADARDALGLLSEIYKIEIQLVRQGMATDVRISGGEPGDAYDAVFDAIESALLVVGPPNAELGQTILQAARLYADNANVYNLDEETARRERDNLLSLIVERGKQARTPGFRYTAKMKKDDSKLLKQANKNIQTLATQARKRNITVLTSWMKEIRTLPVPQNMKQHMQNLMTDLDNAIKRLKRNTDISQQELTRLTTNYLMISGKEVPLTEEKKGFILGIAQSLRGKRKQLKESSVEWFAEQGINAINQGDVKRAALAISLAMLERNARRSRKHAKDYILGDYRKLLIVLTNNILLSDGKRRYFGKRIDAANMTINVERLERIKRGKGKEKRDLIRKAAKIIRQRLDAGDHPGARRLLNMALAYHDRLTESRWKPFTGILIMETAMNSEIGGLDSSERFNLGMRYNRITEETKRVKKAIRDWHTRGMRAQRRHVDQMLTYIDGLAKKGESQAASRAMTLISMYFDTVKRLGVTKRGKIVSIRDEHAAQLRGMETAMASLRTGKKVNSAAFMKSFRISQQSYVEMEITRLRKLVSRRTAGRAIIERALETARKRAQKGEIRGANLLLQFIMGYYGESGDGRKEGWRYALSTTKIGKLGTPRGYILGRRQMLQAIELEIGARTPDDQVNAAKHFDRAAARIAQTQTLIEDYNRQVAILQGKEQIMEGIGKGLVPLGKRNEDGTFPAYVPIFAVSTYEATNPRDATIWTFDSARDGRSTLAARLEQMRTAAFDGNRQQYQRVFRQYSERFGLISARAHRSGIIGEARVTLTRSRQALRDAFIVYATEMLNEGGKHDGIKRFKKLEEKNRLPVYKTEGRTGPDMRTYTVQVIDRYEPPTLATLYNELRRSYPNQTQLLGRLRGLVQFSGYLQDAHKSLDGLDNNTKDVPLKTIAPFLDYARRESKRAAAYSFLSQQMGTNKVYVSTLSKGSGTFANMFRRTLESGQRELESARAHAFAGRYDQAEQAFARAIRFRMVALNGYQASNALTFAAGREWFRGKGVLWKAGEAIGDAIRSPKEFGRKKPDLSPFHRYRDMQVAAFRGLVRGGMTQAQMERNLVGAKAIEVSVFAIPADSASQVFANYTDEQQKVRTLVARGDMAGANRIIKQMQKTVGNHQFYAQVGVTVVGIGAGFFNPLLGGAIFTTMAIDHLVTEYRMTGTTTWTSWLMLGGIIATMGLGGAIGVLRAPSWRVAVKGTEYAKRLERIAKGMEVGVLGIGAGFAIYLTAHANMAFAEGNTREGIFLTAMALFPWLHMGRARIAARRARAAEMDAEVQLQLETLLEELRMPEVREPTLVLDNPTEAPSLIAARQYQKPEAMFRFLRELRSSKTSVRQAAEERLRTLPENIARAVGELRNARLGNVELMLLRRALESGEMSPNARISLADAIRQIEIGPRPEPTPPGGGGPRGGGPRPESTVYSNPGWFERLVGDLLIPDPALVGDTASARAARVDRSIARDDLRVIRAENEPLARIIDEMVGNSAVRWYVRDPGTAPSTIRGRWNDYMQRVRDTVPREAAQAEQRMAVNYYRGITMLDQASRLPPGGVTRGPLEIRASAEGGGPPAPGRAPTPEGVRPAGAPAAPGEPGRPAPRRAAPTPEVRPAPPGEAPAAPPEGAPATAAPTPQEVQMLRPRSKAAALLRGLHNVTIRRLVEAQDARRQALEGRGQETPEGTLETVRSHVEQTLEMVSEPEVNAAWVAELRNAVRQAWHDQLSGLEGPPTRQEYEAAQREVRPVQQQAADMAVRLSGASDNTLAILQALHRFSRQGLGRSAAAGELANRLYSRGNVSTRIKGMAEGEGGYWSRLRNRAPATRLQRDMKRAIREGAREIPGRTVQQEMDSLAQQSFTTADAELVVLALESQRGRRPLFQHSQEVLGTEFSSTERAVLLNALREAGVISPGLYLVEAAVVTQRLTSLRDLPTADRPALNNVRDGLRVRAARGGNMDNTLLELIRQQPEIEAAVRTAYGEEAARIFREAATLDDVLATLRQEGRAQPELLRDTEAFVRDARDPQLVDDFSAMQYFSEAVAEAEGASRARRMQVAAEARDLIPQARARARSVFSFLNKWEPFTNWGGRSFARAAYNAARGGPLRPVLANSPKMLVQLVTWWVLATYGQENIYKPLVERITGARTIREGIAIAKRDFNITISEENAEWVMGGRSSEQATLVRETRDRFKELRGEILKSSASWLPGWVPGVTEVGETLQARQLRTLGNMINEAERKVIEKAGTQKFTKAQEDAIKKAFRTISDQITTQFGDILDANQMKALQGTLNSAQADIIAKFKARLTGATEEGNGMMFFTKIPYFPDGSKLRPGSAESMRTMLKSREIMIDPRRLNAVLDDGREMDGRLREINQLLAKIRDTSKEAEDREEARKELEKILSGWNIRLETFTQPPTHMKPLIRDDSKRKSLTRLSDAIELYLVQNKNTSLSIEDMFEMRKYDWRKRGLAVQFRDVVAEVFAIDCGIMPSPMRARRAPTDAERKRLMAQGREERQFLAANPDVFEFLWNSVQTGYLPAIYVDDVIKNLSTGKTLQDLMKKVDAKAPKPGAARVKAVQDIFSKHLTSANLWMSIPINQNSFLGLLDRRATLEASFRPVYEKLLPKYRGNDAALKAFNNFTVNAMAADDKGRITSGEAIYGDAEALAKLILANPQTAVEEARKKGMVASAILGDIEPRLFDPKNAALIGWIMERSDGDKAGVFRWLKDRRDNIRGRALDIIKKEKDNTSMPGAKMYIDAYKYLDRRADGYLTKGMWVGPTPSKEAERRRAKARRRKERRPSWDEQFAQQPPRRPGIEARPRRAERPTEAERRAGARVQPTGLTEEQRAFFSDPDRCPRALNSIIEGAIDQTIEKKTGSGALTVDAQAMVDRYGAEINSNVAATKTAARERVRQDIKASIYKLLTSGRVSDKRRLLKVWSITTSGSGETFKINKKGVKVSRLRSAIRQHITDHVRSRSKR
jgi:tetratricopeptide (TPR) repeat protein